jgi:nucleoside-diphosphate-sugar epimerase
MPTALVTGATGFTGGALARRLVADGYEVTAFVRATSNVRDLIDLGVNCLVVDLNDPEDVERRMRSFDRVFHIAASYREEHADVTQFRRVNVDATENLLRSAMRAGVSRFIHCSTVGVQGEIEVPPADEEYRVKPGDHYQQSKLEGEQLALEYFRKGLPGSVVRPVGIYGPGDRRFLKLVRPISKGTFVTIGDGKTLYHMTYIDDLIDGFILAGDKEAALNEVFTIGGPQYTSIRELVNLIADELGVAHPKLRVPFWPVYFCSWVCEVVCKPLGVSPPLYRRRTEFFHLDRAFSIEKAQRLLGYQPKHDLKAGMRKTVDAYKAAGLI